MKLNKRILTSYKLEQVERKHIFSQNVDLRETKTPKRIKILTVFFPFLFVCLFVFALASKTQRLSQEFRVEGKY